MSDGNINPLKARIAAGKRSASNLVTIPLALTGYYIMLRRQATDELLANMNRGD